MSRVVSNSFYRVSIVVVVLVLFCMDKDIEAEVKSALDDAAKRK